MKKKQIIALIVAAVVFVFVGASSALTNHLIQKSTKDIMKESLATNVIKSSNEIITPTKDYIGVVNVKGTIQPTQTNNYFSVF